MGNGRNAIYLAKMGFDVEGVDISREAIGEAMARALEEGVSIQAMVADLEKIPYFDEEAYDVVICFNYLQRSLMPQMKNWIKPGGMRSMRPSSSIKFGSANRRILIIYSGTMSY